MKPNQILPGFSEVAIRRCSSRTPFFKEHPQWLLLDFHSNVLSEHFQTHITIHIIAKRKKRLLERFKRTVKRDNVVLFTKPEELEFEDDIKGIDFSAPLQVFYVVLYVCPPPSQFGGKTFQS